VIAVSMRETPPEMKKAAEVSLGGLAGTLSVSCLASPPDVQVRGIDHLRPRTFRYLAIAITAKQTSATGRKRGFCRKA
jgi:hypothetical protein